MIGEYDNVHVYSQVKKRYTLNSIITLAVNTVFITSYSTTIPDIDL